MPSKLRTGWKRIGRSGQTVDGRTIEPEHLRQVAKNYKPDLYKALIWPDHQRWFNMGGVEELRVEDNDEDGVDLFAILSPNEIYLATNRAEQRLFTSMELWPNFRETGEYYLTGLGATDSPASAATSEVRFSRVKEPAVLLSLHTENTTHDFNDDDDSQPPRWFERFFNKKPEGDMDKKNTEALMASISALSESLTAFTKNIDGKPDGDKKPEAENKPVELSAERFSALEAEIKELKSSIKANNEGQDKTSTVDAEAFNKLQTQFDELAKQFKSAIAEQPGTNGGDHVNDGEDLNAYV